MKAHPILSIQRSGSKQLAGFGVSGEFSLMLVLPSHQEDSCPKLPDPQLALMANNPAAKPLDVPCHVSSGSGVVGHMFSSSAGFTTAIQYSSFSSQENHSRPAPFISQSSIHMEATPLPPCSNSRMLQSTTMPHITKKTVLPGAQSHFQVFLICRKW